MKAQQEALQQLKNAAGGLPAARNAFGSTVRPLLPKLAGYVQREVAYLRARGDLAPDYPKSQEIVDEALTRAYRTADQRPDKIAPLHWLYRIAHGVLTETVQRRRSEAGRLVSLESSPPASPDETLDEQDESMYEYWQPDELLTLEDVVPVSDMTSETTASQNEMRKRLHIALAHLPIAWRRAVWLTQAEGLAPSVVAKMLGSSEADVRHWIAQSDAFLRARLEEDGYKLADTQNTPAYFSSTMEKSAPELERAFDRIMDGSRRESP